MPSVVREDKGLQREIVTGIVEAVDGMFLLAHIYLKLLEDKLTSNAVRSALKVFGKQPGPSSENERTKILGFAYEQALERINKQMQGQKELAFKVLLWVTCAKRQLTLSELQHALAIMPGNDSLDEGDLPHIEDMVSVCAGLVTVDKESKIIRLVHYTTQEYLARTQRQWFPGANIAIAMACVTYLSFRVFETGSCDTYQRLEQRLQSNPLYDYAANYWGFHVPYDVGSDQAIIDFLQNQNKVDASIEALMTSERCLSSDYTLQVPRHMIGLHLVGYFGVSKAVDILIAAGQCVNAQDSSRQTPLIYAAINGHKTAVDRLLAAGADINTADNYGETALYSATSRGHLKVVKRLLAAGADINAPDKDGWTALHGAAWRGHLEVVERLLAAGADVNATDKDGWTVLDRAAERGHLEVAEMLLAAGANVNAPQMNGMTALHFAARDGHYKVVETLLMAGANINAMSRCGRTALYIAVERGHHEIVKRLLIAGVDVNTRGRIGETALQLAAKGGHHRIIETLLTAGADVNAPGGFQGDKTALQLAAERGHYEAVETLLTAGADVHATGSFQARKTALQLAAERGHQKVVERLQAASSPWTNL